MPNAGKSTLIRAVSAARPKVADYPFTTLAPALGVVRVDEGRSFVIADIPGLIEGAAEGAGLGLRFLRHLARTRLLLHVVDLAPLDPEADPVRDAKAIAKELKKYDPALAKKPRWLVLNKMDLVPEDEREARVAAFVKAMRYKGPVFAIAAISGDGCRPLVYALGDWLVAHPAVDAAPVEAPADTGEPVVLKPAPVRSRRRARDARRSGRRGMTSPVAAARRIVVKVGSSLVTNDGRGIDHAAVARWAAEIAGLKRGGREVVLVSSGAIAEGMQRLGWTTRPKAIHELQAAAAVGQMGLIQAYETAFAEFGLHTAQVLLTHEDLADRRRYLNARTTLRTLIALDVIPVINENDTVTTDEIRVGDNDTLGALVTNLIEADVLVLLTDQTGLYTADPRKDPAATLVREARAGDDALEAMAGGAGSAIGRGGMLTKVLAAKRAARSGASTVIASGREPDVLTRLAAGEAIGSALLAQTRRRWPRASSGSPTTSSSRARCSSTPARCARSRARARACCRSASSRSRAASSAARSSAASRPTAARSRADSPTTAPPTPRASCASRRRRSRRSSAGSTSPSSSIGTTWSCSAEAQQDPVTAKAHVCRASGQREASDSRERPEAQLGADRLSEKHPVTAKAHVCRASGQREASASSR